MRGDTVGGDVAVQEVPVGRLVMHPPGAGRVEVAAAGVELQQSAVRVVRWGFQEEDQGERVVVGPRCGT